MVLDVCNIHYVIVFYPYNVSYFPLLQQYQLYFHSKSDSKDNQYSFSFNKMMFVLCYCNVRYQKILTNMKINSDKSIAFLEWPKTLAIRPGTPC